ncbi:MAG: hypothetical protein Q8920_10440 [Bacillota bacterium]|nr:hypothetical protein [Bacillota bacterium]
MINQSIGNYYDTGWKYSTCIYFGLIGLQTLDFKAIRHEKILIRS